MNEILAVAIGTVVAAVLIYQFADLIATTLAAIFVAAVRGIQKHCFGIDRPRTGGESMIGTRVRHLEAFSLSDESGLFEGYVLFNGERWRARVIEGTPHVTSVEHFSIVKREGLLLHVIQVVGE